MSGATHGDGRFRPARWLRNPHLQTVLASSSFRRLLLRARGRIPPATEWIVDADDGVRLQSFVGDPDGEHRAPRGTVVLIHGWEGCHGSTYMVSSDAWLRRSGFRVVRLNLRDHGGSHHLNVGLFHSCRLAEVVGAVRTIASRFDAVPLHLAGFSLGGNFALRVAAAEPGLRLNRVIAICPVVDPRSTLRAMERFGPTYTRYFMHKWRRSLRRKQRAHPSTYDFADWLRLGDLTEMTHYLVARYTEYPSLDAYYDGYTLTGDALSGIRARSTIVTSADDPVIPAADFDRLRLPPSIGFELVHAGGHCGFVERMRGHSWVDGRLVRLIADGP